MEWRTGDIFADHYKLVRQLGKGSFGEVWLARNLLADIDVAIKFYKVMDHEGISSFREEFKLAYRLSHPNLLHLNHFDVYSEYPFLVMPFCANGSSSILIGNASETRIWEFIRDVSAGIAYLHNQNPPIIHQDIKPANILIEENGKFVITDFGISKKIDINKQTFQGSSIKSSGTIAYMSPERFQVPPLVVKAGDIWSLGMSVYEIATGNILWGLGGCNQLGGETVPGLGPNYSMQLSKLVQSCLALNTWERPTAQQIHEMAKEKLASNSVGHSFSHQSSSRSYVSNSHRSVHPAYVQPSASRNYKQKPSSNNPKSDKLEYLKWIGGAVLLFVMALLVFNWIFSPSKKEVNMNHEDPGLIMPYNSAEYNDTLVTIENDTVISTENGSQVKKTFSIPHRRRINPIDEKPKTEPKRDPEMELWRKCIERHQIFQYNEYINKYPRGRFYNEAKKRIRELERMNSSYNSY